MLPPVEHNEIFDLAFRFVTETNESIFLTGKAGTGKTTFLKFLRENCYKNIVVAAPTGVAAINAGGVTLHSLFQLPFHPFLPTKTNRDELLATVRLSKQRQQLLRKMDLLVIDEVSMVRCDVMDAVDTILRHVRHSHRLAFGGVQVLCIGDLYQLQPVVQNREWNMLGEYYYSPFFFDSISVKELNPLMIELSMVYRQKDDGFIELLNNVRNNRMAGSDFDLLHSRFRPGFSPAGDENYITLTTHNNQADQINQQCLNRIEEPALRFMAVVEGEFPESMYPADAELVLKTGAQVMFLKNDSIQKRYFNGKIGVVSRLEKDRIIVRCDDADIEVRPETWENTRYTLNRADGKLEQETLGNFSQYPLRLAWAITIHKSQGLTFDKVMIDAAAAFSSGQVYVALSRCTSLEGIILLSKIPTSAITSNANAVRAGQIFSLNGPIAARFSESRKLFTLQLLEKIFNFADVISVVHKTDSLIRQHEKRFNKEAVAWISGIKDRVAAEQMVGLKFKSLVAALLNETDGIEENAVLLGRITDAANHFTPRFESLLAGVVTHPLYTEHKEIAVAANELLNSLASALFVCDYDLQYCKGPFSVTGYLQHKLKMATPSYSLSCYARDISGGSEEHDLTNAELFASLKQWRNMLCSGSGQPVYLVANQDSLKEISTYLPQTKNELMMISGFGKAKADKYGDDIIEMVLDYCERLGLESNMSAMPLKEKKEKKAVKKEGKTDTKTLSLNLFREGRSVSEIAKERNFTVGTIEGHLAHFIGKGEIDINVFVNKEKQDLIKDAAGKYGTQSVRVLIDNLPEGIGYGDVRMVLAAMGLADK